MEPRFSIGDRVVFVGGIGDPPQLTGTAGTVVSVVISVRVFGTTDYDYGVQFDKSFPFMNTLCGKLPDRSGWYCHSNNLLRAKNDRFDAGQRNTL